MNRSRLLGRSAAIAVIAAGVGAGAIAEAQRARETPVRAAVVDRARHVQIASAVAAARRLKPAAELTKAELRAPMHVLVPMLTECFRQAQARDPNVSGVANTKFVVESEPGHGTIFAASGFDAAGTLGKSPEFRACIGGRLDAIVLPPIGNGGRAEITYPITFASDAPDNRGTEVVDEANRAAAARKWADAFGAAERGLELTSLDGPRRRRLIEVAGLAACHLRNEAKARHYYALASPAAEATIRDACARQARLKLTR